jgi:transcriptional repressor NrdR
VKCPYCESRSHVVETRTADGGAVRRRRECVGCGRRFTTYERYERPPLFVRKRDGSRQPFDREKLAGGLLRAAHKRPIERADAEVLVDRIAREVERAGGELPAQRIGDMALAGLERLDRIAYLQFAAVYKGFEDPGEFRSELARLGVEPQAADAQSVSVRPDRNDPRLPHQAASRRGTDE